jgi:hypothetical protein
MPAATAAFISDRRPNEAADCGIVVSPLSHAMLGSRFGLPQGSGMPLALQSRQFAKP